MMILGGIKVAKLLPPVEENFCMVEPTPYCMHPLGITVKMEKGFTFAMSEESKRKLSASFAKSCEKARLAETK